MDISFEPIGDIFLSYSQDDAKNVKEITDLFSKLNIDFFIDRKITGGMKSLPVLRDALDKASCAVVFLSPRAKESLWVWWEVGILESKGTHIIPFVIDDNGDDKFFESFPEFVTQYHKVDDIEALLRAVNLYNIGAEQILYEDERQQNLMPYIGRMRLVLGLDIPEQLQEYLEFGVSHVRFGRINTKEDGSLADSNIIGQEQGIGRPRNRPIMAQRVENLKTKVRVILPLAFHRQLGLTYKPFVFVKDKKKIGEVKRILGDNGAEDVAVSGSPIQSNKVYFLLPLKDLQVVRSREGFLDNYLYPE